MSLEGVVSFEQDTVRVQLKDKDRGVIFQHCFSQGVQCCLVGCAHFPECAHFPKEGPVLCAIHHDQAAHIECLRENARERAHEAAFVGGSGCLCKRCDTYICQQGAALIITSMSRPAL